MDDKKWFEERHKALDELAATWIMETGGFPSKGTILELMQFAYDKITPKS